MKDVMKMIFKIIKELLKENNKLKQALKIYQDNTLLDYDYYEPEERSDKYYYLGTNKLTKEEYELLKELENDN